eukprot:2915231-Alexandrium_andersonii.AAC.1
MDSGAAFPSRASGVNFEASPGPAQFKMNASSNILASFAPKARACADCGLADRGLEPASWRFRDLGPPSRPAF